MHAMMALLLCAATMVSASYTPTKCGLGDSSMISSYGKQVLEECSSNSSCVPLPEYPRPTMTRTSYRNLNGFWEWEPVAIDPEAPLPPQPGAPPAGRKLNSSILVPFPVESCLSGVALELQRVQLKAMWYRLVFDMPSEAAFGAAGNVVNIHFGAVDWMSVVFLNGAKLGEHTGGYDGFSFTLPITSKPSGNELLVWVYDPSDAGPQPQGKQRVRSITSPGGDHYTPSSGIWQTVWLESVPAQHIVSLKTRADLSHLHLLVNASDAADFTVAVTGTRVQASGTAGTPLSVAIPAPQHWSPAQPDLYEFTVTLASGDSVGSYFGMRTFTLGTVDEKPRPAPSPTPPLPRAINTDHGGGDMPGWRNGKLLDNETACATTCTATPGCLFYVYSPASCTPSAGGKGRCWLKSETRPATHKECRISGPIKSHAIKPSGGPTKRPLLNGNFTFAAGEYTYVEQAPAKYHWHHSNQSTVQ
eukprot:COSAG01_NODE_1924_length_8886_cov_6.780699_5_plen_473_part_00